MEKPPVIRLQNLEKTYDSGGTVVKAVRSLTLDIHPGEFVAVMGSSGSGKSTLMNIIGCLDKPTGGKYFLDGGDVSILNRDELATVRNHKIGFVFQGFNLLARTSARENVELPMLYHHSGLSVREQHAKAMKVLDLVGLSQRTDHVPSQLSGGQQQRVAIARALINDPVLVLADEPTGNLDSRTSIEIMGLFQKLNDEGITIVMVTHEPDIAAFTKRNILMRDGALIEDIPVLRRHSAAEEIERLQGGDYVLPATQSS